MVYMAANDTRTTMGHELLSLKEVQNEELQLLLYLVEFCEAHSLRYSLAAGTLLGAIRHNGFIPWDDDIDIHMPRPDYNKLISMKDILLPDYEIITATNSSFNNTFAKIVNKRVRAQEPSTEGVYEGCLWVDIFPVDGAPEDPKEIEQMQRRIRLAGRLSNWVGNNNMYGPLYKRIIIGLVKKTIKADVAKKHMIHVSQYIEHNPGYSSATRVCSFMGLTRHGWSLDKAEYESFVDVQFEGHSLKAMGCWDEYLRLCYGNYMELPPVEKRNTHHLKAWRVTDSQNLQ